MKNSIIVLGLLSIFAGIGFYYFNQTIYTPQKQASVLLQKGMVFFEQNNTEALQKAVQEFASVAAGFPQTQEAQKALYYLAKSYDKLGMGDLALSKYTRLLDENIPAELKQEIRYQIARSEILRAYQEKGLSGLQDMLIRVSNKALRSEIYTAMARHFSRAGNLNKALFYYEKAAQENGENLIAQQEHTRLAKQQKEFSESEPEKEVIPPQEQKSKPAPIEESPESKKEVITRQAQKPSPEVVQEEAKPVAEKNEILVVMFQKILNAIEALGNKNTNSAPEKVPPQTPVENSSPSPNSFASAQEQQDSLQRGIALYEQNLDAQAQTHFDDIIRRSPNTPVADDALNYAGNIAFRNNDFTSAIRYFNDCISNQSKNRDEICYIRKGEAYYQRKDYVKAANVFETVQKIYPRGQYSYLARDWEVEAKNAYFEQRDRSLQKPQLASEQGHLDVIPEPEKSQPAQNITPPNITPQNSLPPDNPYLPAQPMLGNE